MSRSISIGSIILDMLLIIVYYFNLPIFSSFKSYLIPIVFFFLIIALFSYWTSGSKKELYESTNKGNRFLPSRIYFQTLNGMDQIFVGANVIEELIQFCIKERKEIREHQIRLHAQNNQLVIKLTLFPLFGETLPFEKISEELTERIRSEIFETTGVETQKIAIHFEGKKSTSH